ncbi:MAG: GNAT family N-acetyltransferase [Alphaproteobacteria bacterium]|nr:GNAT family N-acetyltransferase [Alphaproteobacteria bacterium]
MAEYPHRIDVENYGFDLYKPAATFQVARDLYDVVNRNRDFFRPWLGWVDFVRSPEDEFEVAKSVVRMDTNKYLIYENLRLRGMVGVVRDDKSNQTMEIGYWLDKAANGRGLMTVAVDRVQDLCFEIGGANRVEIRCATENKASRAIPERLNFHLDGVLRAGEVLPNGVVHDIAVYSKLKSEWKKGR